MNDRIGTYFPLIIAALLAATTFWLEQVVSNEMHSGKANVHHDPDLIANQVVIDRFDETGKHITHITSVKGYHYPDDDTADLFEPVVTFMRAGLPAVFSSDKAHAENASKIVVMQGNVKGRRAAQGDTPPMTMDTDELTVLTDDEIARTNQPVVLTHGAASITGVGMEWNNLTGVFTVNNQARTTFQPKTQH